MMHKGMWFVWLAQAVEESTPVENDGLVYYSVEQAVEEDMQEQADWREAVLNEIYYYHNASHLGNGLRDYL